MNQVSFPSCFSRYPLVSGFYKMLEIAMKLSKKLDYFKVRDIKVVGG